MLKKYGIIISIILMIAALIHFSPGKNIVPAEKMDILAGVASDLTDDNRHRLAISTYTFFKKDEVSSTILYASGKTLSDAKAGIQLKDNRKFLSSLEKVILFGEKLAKKGIKDDVDTMFANQYMNDMGWAVVCKGDAKEILKLNISGYPSSSDYIDGLIENSKELNYFSENYKLMDIYVRIEQEGRSLVLPFIEIAEGKPKINGLALFKKYKMVNVTDIKDARIINMLREKSGTGNLDYIVSNELLTSSSGEVNRKVFCDKADTKYIFNIDLDFKEDIVSNTLYKDLESKDDVIKKYESDISKQIKKQCETFINKMQNEYKIDCLELGREACAKYGRGGGVDWDQAVSNAQINVNVKVKIRSFGRGRYAE